MGRRRALQWKPQACGGAFGLSGRLVVAMVTELHDGGPPGRFAFKVDAVRTRWITQGSGTCRSLAQAKRSAERAWTAWLAAADLSPAGAP